MDTQIVAIIYAMFYFASFINGDRREHEVRSGGLNLGTVGTGRWSEAERAGIKSGRPAGARSAIRGIKSGDRGE